MTTASPVVLPFFSAEGDATWWPRAAYPSADDALIEHERVEGSTPGDEVLNAEGAGRRVRLVWLTPTIATHVEGVVSWGVLSRPKPGAVECWEVV